MNRRYKIRRLKDPKISREFNIKLNKASKQKQKMMTAPWKQHRRSLFNIICKEEIGFSKRYGYEVIQLRQKKNVK